VTDSLLAIIPLFALISFGYMARHTILDIKMLPALNQFVYYFAVPALLFNAAYRQPVANLLNGAALSAFVVGVFLTALITTLISRRLFKITHYDELILRGVNGTFANFAYMGIPLTFGLLGEATHAPTISIILTGNLLIIAGSQLLIEAKRQKGHLLQQVWNIIDRSLLRNPIFLSTLLGLIASGIGLTLPKAVATTLTMLAPAAIPVALFCLGASLTFKRTEANYNEISWLIGVKLLIHPAITGLTFYLLGVQDKIWLQAAVLLTALPTGALAHVVAMRYQVFEQSTSQIVVFSTLASLMSVTLWSSWLI